MLTYKTRVSYRTVGPNKTAGNLSCGFIYKPDERGNNLDITFEHYGGLLLSEMQSADEQKLLHLYFEAQQLLCTITSRCFRSPADEDCIRIACRLIERYSGRITGQELAAQMNLGYETLRKQFKSAVGLSIGQYSIRVRVNRAKSLLLRSGLPLETLAVQLGYPDYFSFCKQFKQHTGVSPAQFRRMN